MKVLKNKKGIEIAINFIVMLVLAIAVFIGGLIFAAKFFGHAEKVKASLDSQTEKQIEKLLDSGSLVVLPISTKEIFRNNFDTFGVGVLAKYRGTYRLRVVAYKEAWSGKTPIVANAGSWVTNPEQDKTTEKKNEKLKFLIGVNVPRDAEKGTYIFEVRVSFEDTFDFSDADNIQNYDAPLQMIVKVP
jgi:hypothetical protein